MSLRLAASVTFALSTLACSSDVACPPGLAEDDAGICVDAPKDSSVSAAEAWDASTSRDAEPPALTPTVAEVVMTRTYAKTPALTARGATAAMRSSSAKATVVKWRQETPEKCLTPRPP